MRTQTSDGKIANRGNDTATGTFTNSSGISGSSSLETNLIVTPTSESISVDGVGPANAIAATLLNFGQTLQDSNASDGSDSNNNRFQGRQVYEGSGSTPPNDGCYNAALSNGQRPESLPFAVQGSVWNVGANSGNSYGEDGVGFSTLIVNDYRSKLNANQLPCTATASQTMMIVNNMSGYSDQQFATHTLSVTIRPTTVTVNKDGLSRTVNY